MNISVNNTLKYYNSQALNEKLNVNGRGHNFFFDKSYFAMRYLALWSPGLYNIFWKICKLSAHPSPSLLYTSCTLPKKFPAIFDFDKGIFWIASTFHGHMTSFQRRWDVGNIRCDVLSTTSFRRHVDVGATSFVHLDVVHGYSLQFYF